MGKRCQVCDGPVVNGRCKYCGMPYRNDMELYHLNEDRSEHYRHASEKVRKVMAESEIPLADRNRTVKKTGKSAAVRMQKATSGTKAGRTQTSRVQTSGIKRTAGQSYSTQTTRTYSTRQTSQEHKKKNRGTGKVFWIIVIVLMLAAGQIAEYWDTARYRIEDFINDEFDIDLSSFFSGSSADKINESNLDEAVSIAWYGQDDQENYPDYYIFNGVDYVVGQNYFITEKDDMDEENLEDELTIEPGEYILECSWGGAIALKIKSSSGKDATVKFDEAGQQEKVELHTGDKVSAASPEGQDNYLVMYQIQQYDE